MRVVLAPDSFKGTLSAADVAHRVGAGMHAVQPDVQVIYRPMADGGEGTLAAVEAGIADATRMPVTVQGPNGRDILAHWLLLPATDELPGGTGVIELASTSGIELIGQLRPWDADTTGFGQAIAAALDHGVSRLILGIGSSASTDGGTGLLRALGARFLDAQGDPVAPGARGLAEIATVDRSRLRSVPQALVLTDVTNPLCGPAGAAHVFGPQKGLTESGDQDTVDAALGNLATLLGADAATPGAGAAGGVGMALAAWGAQSTSGAAWLAELVQLHEAIAEADVVITGEGSYDGQSADGKVPAIVGELAAAAGVPVALVAGRIVADASAFAAAVSLSDLAGSGEQAMAQTAHYAELAGAELARQLRA